MAGRRRTREQAGETHAAAAHERPVLVWFRDDLRLADHPALHQAAAEGPVAAIFVLDPAQQGGAQLWWLHHSLAALARDLHRHGIRLILRRGRAAEIVPELAGQLQAASVQAIASPLPWLREADRAVEARLKGAFRRHVGSSLVDLSEIRAGSGRLYTVYSPFARAILKSGPPPEPLPVPKLRAADVADVASDDLDAWGLLPTRPDWAGGLREAWTPGERGAADRLEAFLDHGIDDYDRARDVAGDETGTSHLSPHLRWGEISPRQIWHALGGRRSSDAQRFRSELLWRDFAANLLLQRPELPDRPLRAEYARLPWRDDAKALGDWQRGRSGIPIVDAGMRQLWHTGWMHNRVRMIVASWLTKHLLIDWRSGAAWFLDTLVDGDLASNSANWQWVAGCGTEAQPFFRIFNPLTQARKFDADGAYVRAWVPELAKLPDRWLHQPWAAPERVLEDAGVRLDHDYPRPATRLDEGRNRALAAFADHVKGRAKAEHGKARAKADHGKARAKAATTTKAKAA